MEDVSQYTIPAEAEVCLLECKKAFENLSPSEKLYAHYLSRASWYGGLIVLYQTSLESPGIFLLLQKVFRHNSVPELEACAESALLSKDDFKAFLVYAAAFYANMGNYKSFGDSKIVPGLAQAKFAAFVEKTNAWEGNPASMSKLWATVSTPMYSLKPRERQLGLRPDGITTYFSSNCDKTDAEFAQAFLDANGISAYNTRLFKHSEGIYEVRLASSLGVSDLLSELPFLGSHGFSWQNRMATFNVTRGDYSCLLAKVVECLQLAKVNALNLNEQKMIDCYIESFTTGSLQDHKDGSRFWIQDKGPIVESYIGFIESYRDPFGVRGEFEGFVAVVNKQMSAKFSELVSNAESFLPLLPWPREYEKDKFLRPDFTSLDVLTFAGSGIPAGINIPNYNEIRQNDGFKNVSLGNVLSSGYKDTKITFLHSDDMKLYSELKAAAFEVQVGLHELLGHGSGKLFIKDEAGVFNFDPTSVRHAETGELLTSWYEAADTWDAKFPVIGSSYEECRAECVGMYLCLEPHVLSIFGHEDQEAEDIVYINWLNMVRAGLLALEFYSPGTKTWRQAHMQARFVILRVLLEASMASTPGERLVEITQTNEIGGEANLRITLNRSKIRTVGKKAIGDFLRKLQVYKSTADYTSGSALYHRYSTVQDDGCHYFATLWLDIVLARRQVRKIFVQCNTNVCTDSGSVALVEYEASPAGVVQSFVDRFPAAELDDQLEELWVQDNAHWPIL